MKAYQFRKWFFDITPDNEEYIYFFLAEIKFLLFRKYYFTFHYFNQISGPVTKVKILNVFESRIDESQFAVEGEGLSIKSDGKILFVDSAFPELDLSFSLNISGFIDAVDEGRLTIVNRGNKIQWIPVNGCPVASGKIYVDGNEILADAADVYSDFVISDFIPFRLPVKEMYWGRILNASIRLSFAVTFTGEGIQYGMCYILLQNKELIFKDIIFKRTAVDAKLQDTDGNRRLFLTAGNEYCDISVEIVNRVTVADGSFIDPERFGYRLIYSILKKISKNPRGKKYLSSATVILDTPERKYGWTDLTCIDEYVLF